MASNPNSTAVEPIFVLSRVFDVPRELMFKVWTDPEHVAKWWGPKLFAASSCEMDARPGGAYRIVMRSPEGAEYPVTGVFVEIVKPERIVTILDCSGHPAEWHDMVKPNRSKDEKNPAGILLQTVTFDDLEGKTKLTIRTRFESAAIRDSMLKMGMTEGWSQSLDRLGERLQDLSGRSADILEESTGPSSTADELALKIRRNFEMPAGRVFDAWLDPATLGQWLFATPNGEMLKVEVDPRLGGRFTVIEKRGEQIAEHYGNYVMLERPHRLAFTFRTNMSASSTLITVEIQPNSTGCELTLTHILDPQWAAYLDRARTGWTKILESLSRFLFSDREIVTTRVFQSPRDLVFEAWTEPEHIVKWWGPNGFTTTIFEMDVRPGGNWRFIMHGPDGVDYPNDVVYIEIARPERLVYKHLKPAFRMTVTFEEIDQTTTVTMRMLFETAEERDRVARVHGAVEGARQTLERLGTFLESK